MESEPKESSDLLRPRNKIEVNGNLNHEEPKGPPDGGVRAYSVMVASFLTNGLFFGIINSYSVIYTVLEKHLKDEGVSNSESRAGKLVVLKLKYISQPIHKFHHLKTPCRIRYRSCVAHINH